jgi:hypothetical protein
VENVQISANVISSNDELLMLKVENSLICLVNTQIPAVSKIEGQFILPLKTFIRNEASRCRRLE